MTDHPAELVERVTTAILNCGTTRDSFLDARNYARAALDAMGLPSREQIDEVTFALAEDAYNATSAEGMTARCDEATAQILALFQIQAPLGETLELPAAPSTVGTVEELRVIAQRWIDYAPKEPDDREPNFHETFALAHAHAGRTVLDHLTPATTRDVGAEA